MSEEPEGLFGKKHTYSLLLAPAKVTLCVEVGERFITSGDERLLSYEVKAPRYLEDRRSEVRLSGKEKLLSDLRGVLTVRPGPVPDDKKLRTDETHIGSLSYSEEAVFEDESYPAMYGMEIWLAQLYFDDLVQAARFGKMPSSFSVEVAGNGIKFGWEPDGSGKEWDNKNHRVLIVKGLLFELPLAFDPTHMAPEDAAERTPKVEELPATRGQLAVLTAKVATFAVPMWIAAMALLYIAYRLSR